MVGPIAMWSMSFHMSALSPANWISIVVGLIMGMCLGFFIHDWVAKSYKYIRRRKDHRLIP